MDIVVRQQIASHGFEPGITHFTFDQSDFGPIPRVGDFIVWPDFTPGLKVTVVEFAYAPASRLSKKLSIDTVTIWVS